MKNYKIQFPWVFSLGFQITQLCSESQRLVAAKPTEVLGGGKYTGENESWGKKISFKMLT